MMFIRTTSKRVIVPIIEDLLEGKHMSFRPAEPNWGGFKDSKVPKCNGKRAGRTRRNGPELLCL